MNNDTTGTSVVVRAPVDAEPAPFPEPIAIVGIGLRFPGGANDPETLWEILRDGRDVISEIPGDRWNTKVFYDPVAGTPGKTNACRGGFVEGIDKFDADFFGISPREVARMDPQQRLLLEAAWEALEDAGQPVERISGSQAGVFIGISSQDYSLLQVGGDDLAAIDAHTNTGGAMSIAANRISYCLNLRGPSAAIDTACSSSLVAVHLACQSILRDGCPLALAGGVNVLLKPEPYIGFSRLSMLAPDGRCKAFDAAADGFVRSEGAGIVVLKRLSEAERDGDRIYAVIRGSAVNQDGRTTGLTVPSQEAQAALVRAACRSAGVEPRAVQFVEAHGTGTLVGDPIEAGALGSVLADGRPADKPCALGSIKTNIGHLEPAAGIAGLVKVALSLQHGTIPPNLHFHKPNPDIPFEKLRLEVPRTARPFDRSHGPAIAGVNSFGFGGTNAHVVLQEAPRPASHGDEEDTNGSPTVTRSELVPISARSSAALCATAQSWREYLEKTEAGQSIHLEEVCHTSVKRRSRHDHRAALIAETREELLELLGAAAAGESNPKIVTGRVLDKQSARTAFVFSGQGPQWWAMGRELLRVEPVFRKMIERCDEIIRGLGDWSLVRELTAEEEKSRMHQTRIAQPSIFAIQAALLSLWESWGVRPDAVLGHSVGEVAAVYAAGVLGLEDAVRVIFHRGRCMDFASAEGRMLAVGLAAEEAEHWIRGYEDSVSLAAINSPKSVTLSGEAAPLEEIAKKLHHEQVYNQFLRVNYAFHSALMDPVRDELLRSLSGLAPQQATLPIYSTVSGVRAEGPEFDAEYWWHNVRKCVRFGPAIDGLIDEGHTIFLELAPHPVLSGSVNETAFQRRVKLTTLHSLRRNEPERGTMLKALGTLYTLGHEVAWEAVAPKGGRFVRLPSYPWQRERFWHEPEEHRQYRIGAPPHALLGRQRAGAAAVWESSLDRRVVRWLDDHKVQGHVLLSATSFLEMALAAARELHGPGSYVVEEMELSKACFLPEGSAVRMQFVAQRGDSGFAVYSRPWSAGADVPWTEHVKGRMRVAPENGAAPQLEIEVIRNRCDTGISAEEAYPRMQAMGLEYGPTFRGLRRMWCGEGESLGEIVAPDELSGGLEGYHAHPAVLDACFQAITGTLRGSGAERTVYLPVEMQQVRTFGKLNGRLWSHARVVERGARSATVDVRVANEAGQVLLEVRGFRCQALDGGRSVEDEASDLVYSFRWQLQPRPAAARGLRSARHLPSPKQVVEEVRTDVRRLAADLGLDEHYQYFEEHTNELCTSIVLRALEKLGLVLRAGERLSAAGLIEKLGIAPRFAMLMDRLLEMLREDGIIEADGDGEEYVLRREAPAREIRELLERYPAFYAELTLLGRCGENLAEILKGEIDPLHLIFPDGSLATAEHLYSDSPSLRFYNALARRAFERIVAAYPESRNLRILEIGAGTGGLTSHIVRCLPADRTEYVFTDLSNHFFVKAEEKFRDYPFVRYQKLDIEQNPLEQGFEAHTFDVVIASEVLHATADMRRTIGHVKALLADAGQLLLVEAVRPVRWVDLVFGLTEGWWRFTDRELRPAYPLLSMHKWRGLLEETGFDAVVEASGRPEREIENAVILARGPQVDAAQLAEEAEASAAAGEAAAAKPTNGEPAAADAVPPAATGAAGATVAPSAAPAITGNGTWLVLSDNGGTAAALCARLRGRGDRCIEVFSGSAARQAGPEKYEIEPQDAQQMRTLVQDVLKAHADCLGVLHLWNLDLPGFDEAGAAELETTLVRGNLSIVHLAQVLSDIEAERVPRLWLVTRNAQPVGRALQASSALQASAWGLGRVLVNEVPKLRAKVVDLGPERSDVELDSLVEELLLGDAEDEVALRGEARFVHRFSRCDLEREGAARQGDEQTTSYRMEIGSAGVLDKLTLRECPRPKLEAGQIEVRVRAAGVNFADVMKALGIYPGLADGPVPLGIECSGEVTAVGSGVTEFKAGDPVIAIAPFAFAGHVRTTTPLAARKPEHLTWEEAATIPIAFLTAAYALETLGRMQRGEKVLIHSATGGVGLAAIQLAQRAGVEVFATAGTPEKRKFLQALGVQHVMDSRSVDFADEVMRLTEGRGVDLVLNSLAGEAIRKGLSVLNDFGRFLEIGKRDIYGDHRLGMRPFKRNLSFMAIDLDRVMRERPGMAAEVFQGVMKRVQAGELRALPHRVFPISTAANAFRYMAQAKHLGKVILSMQHADARIASAADARTEFRRDATYLIVGGLGGFGLTVAKWMVERGARHLVLTGRSGAASEEAQAAVEALRGAGADVNVVQADVTDGQQLAGVFAAIDRDMPPLRGVMHAAMVLKDCLLINLTQERMREVWAPKVIGAWNLHRLTQERELDFFVLFSSLASVFGIGGQCNYASANACLDSLAVYRRAQGLPAVAISWGYLSDVGWVARHNEIGERLIAQGVLSFTPRQALALMDRFLRGAPPHVGVMRMDWRRWGDAAIGGNVSPRFAELVREGLDGAEDGARKSGSAARAALLAADPSERQALMETLLREQVARVLGASPSKLDVEKPLTSLGLDSLMGIELRNWIEGELRLTLSMVDLMRGPSVIGLAEILTAQLARSAGEAPAAAAVPAVSAAEAAPDKSAEEANELLARVDDLSDEEVDSMLEELTGGGNPVRE